jgi:hypothetical protein
MGSDPDKWGQTPVNGGSDPYKRGQTPVKRGSDPGTATQTWGQTLVLNQYTMRFPDALRKSWIRFSISWEDHMRSLRTPSNP